MFRLLLRHRQCLSLPTAKCLLKYFRELLYFGTKAFLILAAEEFLQARLRFFAGADGGDSLGGVFHDVAGDVGFR